MSDEQSAAPLPRAAWESRLQEAREWVEKATGDLADAQKARDALLRGALGAGMSQSDAARACGLTKGRVAQIAKKAERR